MSGRANVGRADVPSAVRWAWVLGNGGLVARGIDFRDLVGIFSPLGQPLRLGQSPSLLR